MKINPGNGKVLSRIFYERPTALVALDLMGCLLCHLTPDGLTAGRIVEVEAYLGPGDPASHAARNPSGRARIFWQGAGKAYIYFIYGAHLCFNIITHDGKDVGGVLVRALEPEQGIDIMRRNRAIEDLHKLTSGPGKLTRALGITLVDNGRDITHGGLFITLYHPPSEVTVTSRIGISKAVEAPLRFYESRSPFVSRGKAQVFFTGSVIAAREFLRRCNLPGARPKSAGKDP
jgi:DNA-3-methyladenine glycosylase